jgi:hypothetical protein
MNRSQRPAARRNVRLPVELTFGQSALRLFGESRNLSKTGMLVLSEDPKPPGTPVRFEFEGVRGHAKVVWKREEMEGSLLGIRFTGLGSRSRATLVRILRETPLFN